MNIDDITSGRYSSPADLIDLDEVLHPQKFDPLYPPADWAFRGQSQTFGTLVPSFQRIFGQKQSTGAAEIIERDLIETFRRHYATLEGRTHDMPTPSSIGLNHDLQCLM
jgi:hypothetical protein